jgi:hypothetical protein
MHIGQLTKSAKMADFRLELPEKRIKKRINRIFTLFITNTARKTEKQHKKISINYITWSHDHINTTSENQNHSSFSRYTASFTGVIRMICGIFSGIPEHILLLSVSLPEKQKQGTVHPFLAKDSLIRFPAIQARYIFPTSGIT